MREKDLKEDLATLAFKAEADHEVQMARADLYKIAKYAIKMHEMLKGRTEEQGLEGWVQSKITKAADYIGSVYHNMDYEMKFDEVAEGKKKWNEMKHKEKKLIESEEEKLMRLRKILKLENGVDVDIKQKALEICSKEYGVMFDSETVETNTLEILLKAFGAGNDQSQIPSEEKEEDMAELTKIGWKRI